MATGLDQDWAEDLNLKMNHEDEEQSSSTWVVQILFDWVIGWVDFNTIFNRTCWINGQWGLMGINGDQARGGIRPGNSGHYGIRYLDNVPLILMGTNGD